MPNDILDIPYVGGNDGNIACHSLFHYVRRSLGDGREDERIASIHVFYHRLMRQAAGYDQFDVLPCSPYAFHSRLSEREVLDRNLRIIREEHIVTILIPTQHRSRFVAWNGAELREIDSIRNDEDFLLGPSGRLFHLCRFHNDGIYQVAELAADRCHKNTLRAIPSIHSHRSQNIIAKVRRDDWSSPLQTRDQAPESIVPMHNIITFCK